jgi:catechol 2,3-dioxygenase-like lactoylglutathione lyase family enzyme
MGVLPNSLQFHHIGCLTESMENSINTYTQQLGFKKASDIITIEAQQVEVCFLETAPGVFLELVKPLSNDSFLTAILKTKNPYYHTGYLVKDISSTIDGLQEAGFYLVNRFRSEAFANKECAFLYTQEMHLIELIEI